MKKLGTIAQLKPKDKDLQEALKAIDKEIDNLYKNIGKLVEDKIRESA